jgi:hypothetical protein
MIQPASTIFHTEIHTITHDSEFSSALTCKMKTMELVCHDIVASSGAVSAVYAPFPTHGGINDGDAREPERRNRRDQQLDLLGQG